MVYESQDAVSYEFTIAIYYWELKAEMPYLRRHIYKFHCKSLKGENSPFDIPTTRNVTDSNLIVIIADNSARNEVMLSDLLHVFIEENIASFM